MCRIELQSWLAGSCHVTGCGSGSNCGQRGSCDGALTRALRNRAVATDLLAARAGKARWEDKTKVLSFHFTAARISFTLASFDPPRLIPSSADRNRFLRKIMRRVLPSQKTKAVAAIELPQPPHIRLPVCLPAFHHQCHLHRLFAVAPLISYH
jgi:hypothetical protein